MATLNINGQRVTVDDSFLQLSPEQQNATVEEITRSLPAAQSTSPDAAATQPHKGRHLSFEEGAAMLDQEGPSGAALAGSSSFINGIPIVGPSLQSGIQGASAGLRSLIDGEPYADVKNRVNLATQAAQEQHPNMTVGGQVAGAVVPMLGLGATQLGGRILGMSSSVQNPAMNLLARAGASAASNAAISGADTLARGGTSDQALGSAEISGAIGGAIPIVGAGLKAGIGAVADRIAPTVNALIKPDEEAARRVGIAMSRDATANPTMVLSPTDEAVARSANIPVVNADRGGEVTRALVRSVSNQSPEARAVFDNTASDRFAGQSQRAVGYIRKLFGGQVDDLAYHDALRQAADAQNGPAYRAAFSDPNAQAIYTPRIQQLMQSPAFRSAVEEVPARSADRGALAGQKALANPFERNSQGNYVLRRSADGTQVNPTLQFWDQVKRNLDGSIGVAKRGGDNTRVSDLTGLKNALLGELDNTVSTYKGARQGAASFFGAEDALDAGRKFANSPRSIPEATRAVSAFTPAQKQAFSTGYASELIDKLKVPSDRANVIQQIFGNQASRESAQLALGPQRAAQIEAYARVEQLADKLRGSLGNSTTARQLVELGIGAGVGGGAGYGLTGDWKGAALGAVAPRAMKYMGAKADSQVMQSMARLLMQDNPGALQAAASIAAKDPAYMSALTSLGNILAPVSRGIAIRESQ